MAGIDVGDDGAVIPAGGGDLHAVIPANGLVVLKRV